MQNNCNGCEYAENKTGGIYCNLKGILIPYDYVGCIVSDYKNLENNI